jgi:sugar lactone lactonase YvrE
VSDIRKVDRNGTISTFLGNGTGLNYTDGIAFDPAGNLFIADSGNNVILQVDANGTITTFAGTSGTSGSSGDGGPATSAQLNSPSGMAFDSDGNCFIADSGNNVTRKVDTNGIISTFAGTIGTSNYSGDGGPAASAELSNPAGIACDPAGNLFIADSGNNVIRKVDANGTITTFAGSGTTGYSGDGGPAASAELNSPSGVAFDSAGNCFIADKYNSVIRRVDSVTGIISTVAGYLNVRSRSYFGGDGGPATSAKIWVPQAVSVDAAGNLFIADTANLRIRIVYL